MFTEKKYLTTLLIQSLGLLGLVSFLVVGESRTLNESMYYFLLFAVPVAMFFVGKNTYNILTFDTKNKEYLSKKEKYEKENMKTYLMIKKLKERGDYYPRSIYYTRVLFVSIIYVALLFSPVAPVALILFIYYLKNVFDGSNYYKIWQTKMQKKKRKSDAEKKIDTENKRKEELYDAELDMVNLMDESLAYLPSYPNPENQRMGYQWSTALDVFKASKEASEESGVYIDNFVLSNETLERIDVDMNEDDLKVVNSTRMTLTPIECTRTLLLVGSMGSGKTQTINKILEQSRANRTVIIDVKGDFTERFYNPERDTVISYFDERSSYWDLFAEMESGETEIITAFISNLVQASIGDEGKADFFSNQAKEIILKNFMSIGIQDIPNEDKWELIIAGIEQWIADADNNTKSSIAMTIELAIEIFKLSLYRMKNGAKPFTLSEFFERKEGQNLFILSNDSVSSKLQPFITGFVASITSYMLGQPDTKTDLTHIILDEFLDIKMEKSYKKKLLTKVRSKGGMLVIGLQYIPTDKEQKQLIESSRFATMYFTINDTETAKSTCDSLGKIEYMEDQRSYSRRELSNGGFSALNSSKKWSHTEQVKTRDFLESKKLLSMPTNHHITHIAGKDLIYLAITELPTGVDRKNDSYVKIDMKGYYNFLYKDDAKKEEPIEITLSSNEEVTASTSTSTGGQSREIDNISDEELEKASNDFEKDTDKSNLRVEKLIEESEENKSLLIEELFGSIDDYQDKLEEEK